jgi:hypothetical protein
VREVDLLTVAPFWDSWPTAPISRLSNSSGHRFLYAYLDFLEQLSFRANAELWQCGCTRINNKGIKGHCKNEEPGAQTPRCADQTARSKAILDSGISISGLVAASTSDIEESSIEMVGVFESRMRLDHHFRTFSPPSSFQRSPEPV